jgi:ABC-type transporter Mla MlaB component
VPHPKLRQSQGETLHTFGPISCKPLLTLWIHSR